MLLSGPWPNFIRVALLSDMIFTLSVVTQDMETSTLAERSAFHYQ